MKQARASGIRVRLCDELLPLAPPRLCNLSLWLRKLPSPNPLCKLFCHLFFPPTPIPAALLSQLKSSLTYFSLEGQSLMFIHSCDHNLPQLHFSKPTQLEGGVQTAIWNTTASTENANTSKAQQKGTTEPLYGRERTGTLHHYQLPSARIHRL